MKSSTLDIIAVIAILITGIFIADGVFRVIPKQLDDMKISKGDLEILTEYKNQFPELITMQVKKHMDDGFISRKEFREIRKEVEVYKEQIMYKNLTNE